MDFLPIFMTVRGRRCLLVGGGEVAGRKARLLLEAGACVEVVAPELGATLGRLVRKGRVAYRPGVFEEGLLAGATLVFAATDSDETNRRVYQAASSRGIPVNVVDAPELSTFIMPSIVDRSPVVIAVSTGGAAPVLARLLRARLETVIPAAYGRLAALAAQYRARVKARIPARLRRRFWESVFDGPIAEQVYAGQEHAARAALERMLEAAPDSIAAAGAVYLVGAGPGDPDLLTFRALRLMQQADVVVYDRLVSPEVLRLVRREAELIYAGKERAKHTLPQEDINRLLVRLAREGKRVVRLKGGDPFIFGRGGEEIETLMQEGITFAVVPGITAAVGCAAYAGIPLTHREFAHTVVFATAHRKDGGMDLNWDALIQPRQTLVFYMGLLGLRALCMELIGRGLARETPAALVQQGTTRHQRVLTGTLETLPDIVERSNVKAPTLVIVGEVVRLREKLRWFESGDGGAAI